jgi:hypothetical protein
MSFDPHLAGPRDEDRYRGMERRLAIERALRETAIERATGEHSAGEPFWARLLTRLRPDHSLTPYACRLPSGELGRTAIKFRDGEWTAVCVPG